MRWVPRAGGGTGHRRPAAPPACAEAGTPAAGPGCHEIGHSTPAAGPGCHGARPAASPRAVTAATDRIEARPVSHVQVTVAISWQSGLEAAPAEDYARAISSGKRLPHPDGPLRSAGSPPAEAAR